MSQIAKSNFWTSRLETAQASQLAELAQASQLAELALEKSLKQDEVLQEVVFLCKEQAQFIQQQLQFNQEQLQFSQQQAQFNQQQFREIRKELAEIKRYVIQIGDVVLTDFPEIQESTKLEIEASAEEIAGTPEKREKIVSETLDIHNKILNKRKIKHDFKQQIWIANGQVGLEPVFSTKIHSGSVQKEKYAQTASSLKSFLPEEKLNLKGSYTAFGDWVSSICTQIYGINFYSHYPKIFQKFFDNLAYYYVEERPNFGRLR